MTTKHKILLFISFLTCTNTFALSKKKSTNQVNKTPTFKFEDGLKKLYEHKFKDAKEILHTLSLESKDYHSYYYSLPMMKNVYVENWDNIRKVSVIPPLANIGKLIFYLSLGMSYSANNQFQKSIDQVKNINLLMEQKDSNSSMDLSGEIKYSSKFLMGYIRYKEQRYKAAIRLLKQAGREELRLKKINALSWVFNSFYYLGLAYEAVDNKQDATLTYEKLFKRWPHFPIAQKQLNLIKSK